MPHLLVFGVCQKVIVDKESTLMTMIGILTGIKVQIPEGESLPDDAAIATEMAAATIWRRNPEDEGKTFEQKVEIIFPDGSKISDEQTIPFAMENLSHQNVVRFLSYPIQKAGIHLIRLLFREIAEGEDWRVMSDYPFEVIHLNP